MKINSSWAIWGIFSHFAVPLFLLYSLERSYEILFDKQSTWAFWIIFVLLCLTLASIQVHRSSTELCIRCMKEVPHDAAEKAQTSHLWFLWFYHRFINLSFAKLMIAAVVISWLSSHVHPWIDLVVPGYVFVYAFSLVWHTRLSPWCPYCRRGGGGGDSEVVPDPDPAGVKQA